MNKVSTASEAQRTLFIVTEVPNYMGSGEWLYVADAEYIGDGEDFVAQNFLLDL